MAGNPKDSRRTELVDALRSYLKAHDLTRDAFAEKVHLSRSTIDKMFIGLASDRAIARVARNTGLRLGPQAEVIERAAPDLGGYPRSDVAQYLGEYAFVRPAADGSDSILAFRFEIGWDASKPGLLIHNTDAAAETAQFGHVAIPNSSRHIFITSNDRGWAKLLIVSQLDVTKTMLGVILTVGEVMGAVFLPMTFPVAFIALTEKSMRGYASGRISSGSDLYGRYRELLGSVSVRQFAKFITL